jgi:murein L,D-transpeptidase YafK
VIWRLACEGLGRFQAASHRWGMVFQKLSYLATCLAVAATLTGCVSAESVLNLDNRSSQPIPAKLVGEMSKRGMSPSSPILIRIFKEESELEVWKRDRTGRYALLKTYPMCRWSGKLGPKTRDGDRQAPEGFYHVSAGMMNPNSQYYLSFNLGYPNKLESALGYSGESLMVHGACSSSGCYAMTDEGVAEIYATAREALKGGQSAFQVQAFPFRMTPENMARNRNDPNYAFWENLKQGYDIFEVTRKQPQVAHCGKQYVFDAKFEDGAPTDPLASCPAYTVVEEPAVAARRASDGIAMAKVLSEATTLSTHAYSDGGMHMTFRQILERRGAGALAKKTSVTEVPVSRPEAALADPHDPKKH